jgi:hypothetical protein
LPRSDLGSHSRVITLKAARHRELARKYKRKKRERPPLVGLRVRDLNKLFRARYGEILPDDDSGRDDVAIVAHHLAQYADGHPARRITQWVRLRAPWMPIAELDALIAEAIAKPKRWRADKLAWRLRLTAADRSALRITTIGAIDASKGQRSARRRERDRKRKMLNRRASGAQPRPEYEAQSLERAQPWTMLGISRRTWYRHGKPTA